MMEELDIQLSPQDNRLRDALGQIAIRADDPDSAEARSLIEQLDALQCS